MKRGMFSVALVTSAIIVVSLIGCGSSDTGQLARIASVTDLKSGVWDVHSAAIDEQNVTIDEFFGTVGAVTASTEFLSAGQWDSNGTFTITLLDGTNPPLATGLAGTWAREPSGIVTLTGANMTGVWGAVIMDEGGLLVLRRTEDDGTTRQIAFSP